jgi:hypothetical protein
MNHLALIPQISTVKLRDGLSLRFLAAGLLAVALSACSSTSDPAISGSAGAGNGSAGASAAADVGTILASAEPCTKPNTFCMALQVPDTMTGPPAHLMFELFDSAEPPNHPPNGIAGDFTLPNLTPGETIHVELSDGGLQGDYWVWALAYMNGTGHGAPVVGVDYRQTSAPSALHLDGSPLNIAEPIVLTR